MKKIKAKQALNVLSYVVRKKEPVSLPLKVAIEITQRCNSKCHSCDRWYNYSKIELSTEEIKKILRDAREMGTSTVSITGGEALLRKDVYEILKYGKSLGLHMSLNSNAIMINDHVAKKIIDTKVDLVSFSLDGSKAEIHDPIRGVPGNFDRVLEAIKSIQKFQVNNKPSINLNMTISAMNKDDIVDTVKLTKSIGVDSFTIQPVQEVKEAGFLVEERMRLTEEDYDTIDKQLRYALKHYPEMFSHSKDYLLGIKPYLKKPKEMYKYKCVAGYLYAAIYPNGDVFPCPIWKKKMGNIRESSFKELWFSDKAKNVRKLVRDDKHPICWFNCMSSMNVPMHYARNPLKWGKLLSDKNFIKYALKKAN